jgi:phosphoglycolate phosphatase
VTDRPRAVIFDLDGTLAETAADIHAILAEVLAEDDLAAPDLPAVRAMIGDGARVLIERALGAIGQPLAGTAVDRFYQRFRDRYAEVPCRHSVPYEGARKLLTALRAEGWRLGLCTNKPQVATVGLLRALQLDDRFDSVASGDRLPGVRKPDPAHLAAVLDELGVAATHTVMVGDSRNDLLTARALGVPCILVSFGYTPVPARELGADAVVDSLAEVPAAIARLR